MLPPTVLNTLRYGEALATKVDVKRPGWTGWIFVEPRFATPSPSKQFPLPINDTSHAVRYSVRRIEMSEWHLDERWALDLDKAIEQRPIVDEIVESADEEELERALCRWSCDPESLNLASAVQYPHPPRNHRGDVAAVSVKGILRGAEGETRHLCWQCPDCGEMWSDDFEPGDTNPFISSCGWSQRHSHGAVTNVSISWQVEQAPA